jgi:4-diphosphocytidyl-2-C-methyl-D-erythritol kinase
MRETHGTRGLPLLVLVSQQREPLHQDVTRMRLHWQGQALVVRTPAKLNLFLDVLGKRPDGYHELETLMVSIGLYDTLRFQANASGRLELSLDDASRGMTRETRSLLPLDERNLVLKAALLLREQTGCTLGASIQLTKSIPLQAGLGGGSSDAAAALVGLNHLWNLGLTPAELHPLAARLGSDVNFFLDSIPLALCRGRGEQITPQTLSRPLHCVIVKPPGGLSTRDVFLALRSDRIPRGSAVLRHSLRTGDLSRIGTQLHNALEVPAVELSEEVTFVLASLARVSSVGRLMTGSGSSCFALCAHRGQAVRAAHLLRASHRGQVFVVQTAT